MLLLLLTVLLSLLLRMTCMNFINILGYDFFLLGCFYDWMRIKCHLELNEMKWNILNEYFLVSCHCNSIHKWTCIFQFLLTVITIIIVELYCVPSEWPRPWLHFHTWHDDDDHHYYLTKKPSPEKEEYSE